MAKHKVRNVGTQVHDPAPKTAITATAVKKNGVAPYLISILLIAAALCVTLISSIHTFILSADNMPADDPVSVFLAVLSLISWAAVLFLSYLYRFRYAAIFSSILWWADFCAFLFFCITGTTDALSDSFFELLFMIFSVPSWSYVAIVQAFGQMSGAFNIVISLIPAFLIAAGSTVICFLSENTKK